MVKGESTIQKPSNGWTSAINIVLRRKRLQLAFCAIACLMFRLPALHVLEIATGASIEACLDMLNVRAEPVLPRQMRSIFLSPELAPRFMMYLNK